MKDGSVTPAGGPAATAIRLTGITKRFPGVVANSDVNLDVRTGEVHAVVGENGAGKSTLMKTLYGMHRPDEGTIEVGGTAVTFSSPRDAIAAGIGMVHQHFMLADNLTVAENIVLGSEPRRGLRLDKRTAVSRLEELSRRYGLNLRPDRLVDELSVADRQRVEIAKVLYRGARVLILDEPTAVLVPQEVDELFESLRGLRAEGLAVVFISHKLDEVLSVADRVTVIRRGTTVATVDRDEVTARRLAELMVGSQLPTAPPRTSAIGAEVVLDVRGLTVRRGETRALTDVGFSVRRGEVVGFAGVEGNGQSELVEALLGVLPVEAGQIAYRGEEIGTWPTLRRRAEGIAVVPEDRQRQALLLDSPLWENRILGHQSTPPVGGRFLVHRAAARADTTRIMQEYDVRAPGIDTSARALSGGNQQKLIIGREMSGDPQLLVAAHPTRGVDVGAQAAIWGRIRDARDAGLGTVLVSADLDELIGLSDTIHVLFRGQVVATVDPADATPEVLGSYMTGGYLSDDAASGGAASGGPASGGPASGGPASGGPASGGAASGEVAPGAEEDRS